LPDNVSLAGVLARCLAELFFCCYDSHKGDRHDRTHRRATTGTSLAGAEPLAIDPQTQEEYVLVRRKVYQKLKGLLGDDDPRLMYPMLADLDPEDWEDAAVYEDKP
jgi:hypothetical protein